VSPRSTRSAVRQELELHLTSGRCAYCRARGSPDRPLTREHLIPRSKGGGRHDHRVIVPACARCNRQRGCQALTLFLLSHPHRIFALLDHFASLSPDRLPQIDLRVFAEIYAALWVLEECCTAGAAWRGQLQRLRGGRRLHRRRYAARRILVHAGMRLSGCRTGRDRPSGPSCLLTAAGPPEMPPHLEPSLGAARARLWNLLSLAWRISAEEIEAELRRVKGETEDSSAVDRAVPAQLFGDLVPRQRRPRGSRRLRVDHRRGRGPRPRRGRLSGRRAA
jgi:hypothetical protein